MPEQQQTSQEQQMTPEQQEELKQKLENMSPEELREFQKKQCIFCHIVSGKVNARKIYEDDKVLGILDINPGNPGHVLLMPKEHYMIMPQIPEDELLHIFIIAKKLSNTLLKALEVRGTNIIVANGPAAGQKAQHFMLHIIPRKEGDGMEFTIPSNKYSDDELNKIAKALRAKLGQKEEKTAADALAKPNVVEAEFEEGEIEGEGGDEEPEDEEDKPEENDEEPQDEDSDEEPGEEDDASLSLELGGGHSDKEEPKKKSKPKRKKKAKKEEHDDDDDDDDDDEPESKSGEAVDLDSIARVLNG